MATHRGRQITILLSVALLVLTTLPVGAQTAHPRSTSVGAHPASPDDVTCMARGHPVPVGVSGFRGSRGPRVRHWTPTRPGTRPG